MFEHDGWVVDGDVGELLLHRLGDGGDITGTVALDEDPPDEK